MQLVNRADQERQTSTTKVGGSQKPVVHKIEDDEMFVKVEQETGPADAEPRFSLPAHFTTARAKAALPMKVARNPLLESDRFEKLITRKLGEKRTTLVTLCLDPVKRTYKFKAGCEIVLDVDRSTLQNATQAAIGVSWVRVRIGTETLRLKLDELRDAFHKLEES